MKHTKGERQLIGAENVVSQERSRCELLLSGILYEEKRRKGGLNTARFILPISPRMPVPRVAWLLSPPPRGAFWNASWNKRKEERKKKQRMVRPPLPFLFFFFFPPSFLCGEDQLGRRSRGGEKKKNLFRAFFCSKFSLAHDLGGGGGEKK